MADNKSPDSKIVDGKKRDTDRILSDFSSDEDDNFVQCELCGVEFVDVKGYEQHLKGKKHQKTINRMKIMSKVAKMTAENGGSKSESDGDENESQIQCDVCHKSFSGHVPYYTHLQSNIHAKNLKKLKLKEQMKGLPEVLNHDETEDSHTNDEDAIIPKPIAKCETCLKVFYGPESFHQHMKSSAHKKKTQQKAIADTFKSQDNENGENVFTCTACRKSFSGPIPYMTHLKSAVHEREMNKAKVASEIKEFCKETDDKHVFICKECEKKFTDPFALKTHLASNDHEKQEAKEKVMQFLSLYPEIMLVKPLQNLDSDDDADDLFFICKICKVSLTGPECAESHIRSKNHIATKKKMKIVSYIKQSKEQADANDKKTSEKENIQENGYKNARSNHHSNHSESMRQSKDNPNQKEASNVSKKNESFSSESNDGFELI